MKNQEICPAHAVWYGDEPLTCPGCDAERAARRARNEARRVGSAPRPACPDCGSLMRKQRNSGRYVCPRNEARRESGRKDDQHAYVRAWTADELALRPLLGWLPEEK